MKKSQVLATIALAFALGVVAPVSGVVMTSDTYAYNTTTGTATKDDVETSIEAVYADDMFKNYAALQDLNAKYNTGVKAGTIADLPVTAKTSDDATSIYNKIVAAQTAGPKFGYNTSTINTNIFNQTNAAKQLTTAVEQVASSELYNAYAGVYDVINDPSATDAQLVTAVTNYRVVARRVLDTTEFTTTAYDNLHPEEATLAAYRANNPIAGNYGALEATNIYNAIQNAKKNLAKFEAGYDLYMPFLEDSGLLTQAGADVIASRLRDDVILQPKSLNYLATSEIAKATELKNVYNAWTDAKNGKTERESGDNMTLIRNLATAYKALLGSEKPVDTIMQELVDYTAPVDPTDPEEPGTDVPTDPTTPTNPTTPDNTNNGQGSVSDGTGFGSTPNTGVVAKSGGSASTSVAIMAAISTVVAGFGAAIVAIRNFKRNKNA